MPLHRPGDLKPHTYDEVSADKAEKSVACKPMGCKPCVNRLYLEGQFLGAIVQSLVGHETRT